MKTIATTGRGSLFRTLFVLAALGGIYYFRKQGGTLASAKDWIKKVAPSASDRTSNPSL